MATSLLFFIPSAALAAVLLLWYYSALPNATQRYTAAAALLLPFITSAIVLILSAGRPIGHIELEGIRVSFRSERGDFTPISVGGCATSGERCLRQDKIHIRDYPPEAFQLRIQDQALVLEPDKGFDHRMLVAVNGQIQGVKHLEHGDRITVAGPDSHVSSWQFEQGGIAKSSVHLMFDQTRFSFPTRAIRIPLLDWQLPLLTFPDLTIRVYPLGQISNQTEWQQGQGTYTSILFGDPRHPQSFNGASLLALDAKVSINEQPLWPYPVSIPDGSSLTFYRLEGVIQPHIRRVLAIREVKRYSDSLVLSFASAYVQRLLLDSLEDNERLVVSMGRGLRSEDRSVRFRDLSEAFSNAIAFLTIKDNTFTSITPQGQVVSAPYGQVMEVGVSDRLRIRLNRNKIPWYVLRLLSMTACGVLILAWRWLDQFRYLAVLGFISILTTARLLFAYAAATLPPFSEESLALALYLLPTAPAMVIAMICWVRSLETKGEGSILRRVAFSLEGFATLLFALLVGIPSLWEFSPSLALGALAPLAAMSGLIVLSLVPPIHRLQIRRDQTLQLLDTLQFRRLWKLTAIVYIVRLFLLFLGFKERLDVGFGRLPLSTLFIPAYVGLLALGCASYLGQISRPGGWNMTVVKQFGSYALGVTALHMLLGLLVSDLGSFIYLIPASLFLAAIGRTGFGSRERRVALLFLMPLILILLFFTSPVIFLRAGEMIAERDFTTPLRNPNAIITEQNVLRFIGYLIPEHLEELGLRNSEAIAQHLAIVKSYTQHEIWGEGFLSVPVPPSMHQTSLNDNVAAVYLMAQFGVLGAASLILAYCALAGIGFKPRAQIAQEGAQRWRFASSLSMLAALVLITVSLYILAANCNLVPFTGRNMYFLGLNSLGDIYESLILLTFVVAGLAIGETE